MPNIYDNRVYKGVLDAEAIRTAQSKITELFFYELDKLKVNQFLMTADEQGISEAEAMFNSIPDRSIERLEFRRQRVINRNTTKPPYTYRYLQNKLDEIFGIGNYMMRRVLASRTLYVESSVESSQWYIEVSLTVNKLKPANMVYINNPYIKRSIDVAEQVEYGNMHYKYRLGTSWILGQSPFLIVEGGGIVKMPEIKSITEKYLSDMATYSVDDVDKARVNNTIVIKQLSKSVIGAEGSVEYTVTKEQTTEITKVELLDSVGQVLTTSSVYIPVSEPVQIKHRIAVKEGGKIDGK